MNHSQKTMVGSVMIAIGVYLSETLRLFFSGTTDSTGAATLTVNALPTQFAVFTMSAQCSGNPNWTVSINNTPVTYGNGPQVHLGPIATAPGERVLIGITGGLPSTSVTGSLSGTTHLTVNSAAANYVPAPNPVTVQAFSSKPEVLGTLDPAAGSVSGTFLVPPGTQSIGIAFSLQGGRSIIPTLSKITGSPSSVEYIEIPSFLSGTPAGQWSTINPLDTSVTLAVTATANAANVLVMVIASKFPMVGQTTADLHGNVAVSAVNSQPALWQGPIHCATANGSNVNGGASLTLISGVTGTVIYLHWIYLTSNTVGAAANSWLLQDTAANRYGANSNTTQQDGNPIFNCDRKGLPIQLSTGFQVVNQQGGALAIYGMIDYQQQ